ncbi:MAG: ribosome recycling factor [Candidatus Eisenbacteria bacterium]|nr:ribosome recycling factor [Candidatus Latescibacterota bacterium]MBD3303480.1 ribosome recycling factor [Candidatus Eisenbacteria bacterium]
MNERIEDADRRMGKSIESLKAELVSIRTGKASPSLLDSVRVDAYGSQMPLSQVASISAPQARLLVIQPWDKTLVQPILKGIQKADLGLNPADDGELIRVPIPALTEERRNELVKKVKKMGEDVKIAIRNIRRDVNEEIKKLQKDGEISEDDLHRGTQEVQKRTDRYVETVDEVLQRKEKEILEI